MTAARATRGVGAIALAFVASAPPAQETAAAVDVAPPSVRVLGRIVSVVGDGVPAAEVWATDALGKVVGRTVADGEGVYQLVRLPFAPLRLHARSPGKVEGSVVVATNGLVRAAMLVLEDGDPLRGTVVLPDGSPAAGAGIVVTPVARYEPPFDWWAETTADEQGRWSLPAVPLRALTVAAFVRGRPLTQVAVDRGHGGEVRIAIARGEALERRVLVRGVPAGHPVRVRVVFAAAPSPVPRDAASGEPRLPRAAIEAAVDEHGVATLWRLPRAYDVCAEAPGFRCEPARVPVPLDDPRDVELTLVPVSNDSADVRLSGRLADMSGAPLVGVGLFARAAGQYGEMAATDAHGSFVLPVPTSATACEVAIVSPRWRLAGDRIRFGDDGRSWLPVLIARERVLDLHAVAGGTLAGALRSPSGAPLAAAHVRVELVVPNTQQQTAMAFETATDADGRFAVSGLPSGRYVVTATGASLRGIAEAQVVAGATVTIASFATTALGGLQGRALGPDGEPLPGAALFLFAPQGKQLPVGLPIARKTSGLGLVLADRNGRFRIDSLAPGQWRFVSLVAQVRGAPEPQEVDVEAGALTSVDVRVPR